MSKNEKHEVLVKVYPSAAHGFDIVGNDLVSGFNQYGHRAGYDGEATQDAIVRAHAFLDKYLKSGGPRAVQ